MFFFFTADIDKFPEDVITRNLGMAMIPGKHVIKVLAPSRTLKEDV